MTMMGPDALLKFKENLANGMDNAVTAFIHQFWTMGHQNLETLVRETSAVVQEYTHQRLSVVLVGWPTDKDNPFMLHAELQGCRVFELLLWDLEKKSGLCHLDSYAIKNESYPVYAKEYNESPCVPLGDPIAVQMRLLNIFAHPRSYVTKILSENRCERSTQK